MQQSRGGRDIRYHKESLVMASERKREQRKLRRRNKKLVVIAPSSLLIEVIEEIFLRLPVKTLMRFKTLSKQWKSTIESRSFAERHLKITERSRLDHPKFMFITQEDPFKNLPRHQDTYVCFRTFCLESSSHLSFTRLNFPQGLSYGFYASECCDGLFCIHSTLTQAVYVVNPATRWFRQLPPARVQILMHKYFHPTGREWLDMMSSSVSHLAFVKADDYKLVWLYNSENYNADASIPNEGVTKCEVFYFRANAWRNLSCTPSYRIFRDQKPAYANGSIYWFTEPYNGRIEVVVFNIYTETFRLLPKLKPAIASSNPSHINMCTLENGLCMSKREGDQMIQEIWRLNSSEDSWEKIYTIDLVSCTSSRTRFRDEFNWSGKHRVEPATPVAICKNKKILLSHSYSRALQESCIIVTRKFVGI